MNQHNGSIYTKTGQESIYLSNVTFYRDVEVGSSIPVKCNYIYSQTCLMWPSIGMLKKGHQYLSNVITYTVKPV
jgi:hypothetical protein